MDMIKHFFSIFFVSFCLAWSSAQASPLSFSARLVNSDGSPTAGPVDLRFELAYSDDTSLIQCSKDLEDVGLSSGVFHANLNFMASDCGARELKEVLEQTPDGESVMMRVSDRTDTGNIKTYPFQALNSVPMSVMSELSEMLVQMGATNGQVLKWDGSKWAPGSDDGEEGTVTQINTGAGLTGGPITGSGTISLADDGVTSAKIDDGTIQNADIGDGQIQYIKLSINDGDIPNAKVDGLGSAALADIGVNAGMVMGADAVPSCAADEKLQMSLGPTYSWTCADDSTATDSTKLPLAGGTMQGGINMDGNVIENLPAPNLDGDAATKKYVDDGLAGIDESKWSESGSDIYYSSGNVGVGTTAPGYKLQIAEVSETGDFFGIGAPGNAGNFIIGGNIDNGGSGQSWIKFGDAGASANSGNGTVLQTEGIGGFGISTGGNERVRISNTGNVGIGTTSPGAKLEVAGQVKITGGAPGAGKVLSSDASGFASWVDLPSSNTPSGSAGGELDGSYPEPLVADGVIDDANVMTGANINANKLGTGVVDNTEFNYLDGVTSSIQTQLGDKVNVAGDTMTGTLNLPSNGLNVGTSEISMSSGNVGIGTATPSASLHVKNSGQDIRLGTGTNSSGYAFDIGVNDDGVNLSNNSNGRGFNFVNPNGNLLKIDYEGKVGIGTTNPSSKLEVNGGLRVGDTTNATTISYDGVNHRMNSSGSGNFLINYANGVRTEIGSSGSPLDFFVNTSNLFVGSGKVGIGITNPTAKLDVKNQTGNAGQFLIRANESRGADGGAHHKAFSIAGNDEDIVEIGALSTFAGGSPSLDHFYINANKSEISAGSGHSTPDFVIDDTGNIGLGVVSPSEKLEVDGNVKATSFFGDGSQLTNVGATSSEAESNYVINADSNGDTNGEIQFQIDGVTQGVMDNAGNMALGQATASAKLDVASSTGSIAQFNMADNTAGNFVLRQDTNEYMNVDTTDGAEKVSFGNTITNPDFIFEGGNVGIGTEAPKQKLSIVGLNTPESFPGGGEGTPESLFQLRSTDCTVDTGPTMLFSTHYSGSNPSTGASISAKREVGCSSGTSFNNHYLAFNVSNYPNTLQEKMRITSTGNVGIGTSSPGAKLEIDASSGGEGLLVKGSGSTNGFRVDNDFIVNRFGRVTMQGQSSGNLIVRPSSSSQVDGSYQAFIQGYSNSGFGGLSIKQSNATGYGLFVEDSNAGSALTVRGDGDVGVGTSSPDAKLDVEKSSSTAGVVDSIGINQKLTANPSSDSASQFMGMRSYVLIPGSNGNNFTDSLRGLFSFVEHAGSGNLSKMYGQRVQLSNTGAGTTGSAIGLQINKVINDGGGTINNTYGVYIDDLTNGTQVNTPYSFYASDGNSLNYFAGDVGIGLAGPSYPLDVVGDINSSTRLRIAGTQVCTSTGCTSSSDARLKEQVISLEDPLKRILELEGVQYEYADKDRFDDQKHIGVIAQDVEKVFPEVVKTDSETGLKSVAYGHLVAPIIEAIKSFYLEFVEDKKENKRDLAQLKDENERLKEENDQIKSYLCQKDPKAPFCSP